MNTTDFLALAILISGCFLAAWGVLHLFGLNSMPRVYAANEWRRICMLMLYLVSAAWIALAPFTPLYVSLPLVVGLTGLTFAGLSTHLIARVRLRSFGESEGENNDE